MVIKKSWLKRLKARLNNYKERFTDYWLGSLHVGKNYIYCSDWPEKKRLFTIYNSVAARQRRVV